MLTIYLVKEEFTFGTIICSALKKTQFIVLN